MNTEQLKLLQKVMNDKSYQKLMKLENPKLINFIIEFVTLSEPDSVFVCDDSDEDAEYIRKKSLELKEEMPLALNNQTVHFDGYYDQGRDKSATKFMVNAQELDSMKHLNCIEHSKGLQEIYTIAKGIMKGKEAIVKLFCECTPNSPFAIACAQITDSFYVAHCEDILYRRGYTHFKNMKDKNDFFRFFHSAGRLDNRRCSIDIDKRRVYQDLVTMSVYSLNTQYAGNSVGLKKLAMRLAIKKSSQEGWLCEHMFIMGCKNYHKNRTTYFTGAFPSACGKTSTAMLQGETIIGDDIAYIRNINSEFRAANVERGIFGIIQDVNEKDDPIIYKILKSNKEMIFSNILVGKDNHPYWTGMGIKIPKEGKNHSEDNWYEGKKDKEGNLIPPSHPNARYTIRLNYLDNLDPNWDNPNGVEIKGIIYAGRDSDTSVPIEESFNWNDGIINKATTLESETTAATLGKTGILKPQPMANLDFISYPLGAYILNNLNFIKGIKNPPKIFTVNYFLKKPNGQFCNEKLDKKVWLHWAELRIHNEVDAYYTPMGLIPKYEDLKILFKDILNKEYLLENYKYEFSFRCDQWIAKLNRCIKYFSDNVADCPLILINTWENTKRKIINAAQKYGPIIEPGKFTPT